jgi:hypothetical protein
MSEPVQVFVFRGRPFARNETIVSAAPLETVVSVYGGGGLKGAAGLEAVFGGSAYFHNDETGTAYLGVWGSRNGGRFRTRLRQAGLTVTIIPEPPPARLKWFSTEQRGDKIAAKTRTIRAVEKS